MRTLLMHVMDHEGDAWPHRLAARVIAQAFKDLQSRHGTRADHDSAREFLAGSAMLRYWCHVGALDAPGIITDAQRRMTHAADDAISPR